MKYSRNKASGAIECYTDEGVYLGNISAQMTIANKHNAEAESGNLRSGNKEDKEKDLGGAT